MSLVTTFGVKVSDDFTVDDRDVNIQKGNDWLWDPFLESPETFRAHFG